MIQAQKLQVSGNTDVRLELKSRYSCSSTVLEYKYGTVQLYE
eukprot:COSAG05_NODE_71_length_22071_cov_17.527149_8_plen_42_part_00